MKARRFGIPEAKRGLAAAAGGLMKLPDIISPKVAMELALTGDFIDAQRAYELGLINKLVGGDAETAALDGAMELARKITENGPVAVRVSKQIVEESPRMEPGRTLGQAGTTFATGVHERGCTRRRGGFRGKTQAELEKQISR